MIAYLLPAGLLAEAWFMGMVFMLSTIHRDRPEERRRLARLAASAVLIPFWPLLALAGIVLGVRWVVRELREDPWLDRLPWRKKAPQDA